MRAAGDAELMDVELSNAGSDRISWERTSRIRDPDSMNDLDDMSRASEVHTVSRMSFIRSRICLADSVALAARLVHQSCLCRTSPVPRAPCCFRNTASHGLAIALVRRVAERKLSDSSRSFNENTVGGVVSTHRIVAVCCDTPADAVDAKTPGDNLHDAWDVARGHRCVRHESAPLRSHAVS